MTPRPFRAPASGQWRARVVAMLLAGWVGLAGSQPSVAPRAGPKAPAEQGVRWQELKPAQQAALKPLEHEWAGIDGVRKQKWLEMSARVPTMTPDERARVQQRMSEWAKLTPQERGQARLHYQEAKQLPAQDRQARWNAYQALSPEQKQELAARAAPAPDAARKPVPAGTRQDKTAREPSQAKSNIVPNPAFAAPPRPIAPTVVQARPGATTTPITKRPSPPTHQQTGLPKIAATPEFVNKATLLPRRGPQGAAATRPDTAAPAERPAQR